MTAATGWTFDGQNSLSAVFRGRTLVSVTTARLRSLARSMAASGLIMVVADPGFWKVIFALACVDVLWSLLLHDLEARS